jgi:uncharacterized membrane protein
LRSSFWFVPTLLVAAAIALALVLVDIDSRSSYSYGTHWPRLFGAGADGARGLLSTVASSMITVAGVVFSITLVSLSLAATQYTSRVLRNFMSDRVNQVVLGVFVGIFAYCLVVLRTIRGGDEGSFVPSLAVFGGLVLAFGGIAVLIHYIHHISVSIQASQILARAARESLRAVDRLFPENAGEEVIMDDTRGGADPGPWHPVAAERSGYLQVIDTAGLLAWADEHDVIVRMERCVGQFVFDGLRLLAVSGKPLREDDLSRVVQFHAIDRQRTIDQDAAFGIRQIVDVALKALSPGINDTTTAVMAVDYLTAILLRLGERRIESRFRGRNGRLRLVTRGPSYGSLLAEAFDQIRQNAEGNATVLGSLVDSLELLAGRLRVVSRRTELRRHAESVQEAVRRSIHAAVDRDSLDRRCAGVLAGLPQK